MPKSYVRLTHPLVRDTRGGELRQATWDEALDRIVARMRAAGPEAVGLWSGHGLAANNYGTRIAGHLNRRFANLYGCQWWSGAIICWGLGGFGLGLTGVLETSTKEDMGQHSRLIVLWGANIASQPNTAPHLVAARRRGAHVVTIDVRETEASARSDETLVIRPGTDAALALGMMHTIVTESLHDHEFVARHTLGFDELTARLARHTADWAADVSVKVATVSQRANAQPQHDRNVWILITASHPNRVTAVQHSSGAAQAASESAFTRFRAFGNVSSNIFRCSSAASTSTFSVVRPSLFVSV